MGQKTEDVPIASGEDPPGRGKPKRPNIILAPIIFWSILLSGKVADNHNPYYILAVLKMKKGISILKKTVISVLALLVFFVVSGYLYFYIMPKGPEVTVLNPLKNGSDSFVIYAYKDSKKKSIKVWTYKPERWKDQDKMVFVMHGGGRNANDYLAAWIDLAETKNLLVIAPEFENKLSNYTMNDYQEGNLPTYFGTKNPKGEWAFSVVENIFDHIKATNTINNSSYDIFGHSAGGQFIHRMVMLMPESRIQTAIAANAGLYTFPNHNLKYPYGMENVEYNNVLLQKAFERNLVILTGELDNDPKLGTFTTTDLAMDQGINRLERGANFFIASRKHARANDLPFNWEIDTVLNTGHDYRKMSEQSIKWLMKE